jgi:hypothetical protein
MVDLLVSLQGLSVPSWKICLWCPKVRQRIQKCIPISFDSPDLPLTSNNIRDIRKGKFKGTKVVPGWLKVEKNVPEEVSDGKKTTTTKWRARDLKDCRVDLEVFCAAMIKSMDLRFSGKSVKRMQKQIVAVDLYELISLCCGHKNLTAVVVDEVKFENYGKQEFLSFWTYIVGVISFVDFTDLIICRCRYLQSSSHQEFVWVVQRGTQSHCAPQRQTSP